MRAFLKTAKAQSVATAMWRKMKKVAAEVAAKKGAAAGSQVSVVNMDLPFLAIACQLNWLPFAFLCVDLRLTMIKSRRPVPKDRRFL